MGIIMDKMNILTNVFRGILAGALLLIPLTTSATKFISVKVIDKDYLMVHFRDGEVRYRDDATGPSAYLGHSFAEGDDTLLVFGARLDVSLAKDASLWTVSSPDDRQFASQHPVAVWRKSKPMNTNHNLDSELDYWLFLQMPKSMRQGCTYTVTIPQGIGSDKTTASLRFDIWNTQSEAVHVSLMGYLPDQPVNHADLYQWLGDGGQRDYQSWEGRKVYLYNVATGKKHKAGEVKFWKHSADSEQEAGKKNLTGTDVWSIDFSSAAPGRYRLVVEDVGCSMDFDIAGNIYYEPYLYSVRGYYYMRLGEPVMPEKVWPVPRQPQFIPDTDPKGFTIYKTDLQPWHPEWRKLRMDVWDEPHFKDADSSLFWQHRLPGNPVSLNVKGGHSDAFDWDRHLAHVSNIYDLLLPYILCGGRFDDDNLGIRESGNGIPDIIDEARNEVDFFLSIRDGEAYSQGVTNPSQDWTVMFQAGCTTMAAWANAANCAILAEAFRISGNESLQKYYTDEAIKAFRFAGRQDDQQLDDSQALGDVSMRGRDFRQMAAAFLYNVTGDEQWERIMAEENMVTGPEFVIFNQDRRKGYCQLWAAAAYISCPRERHYPEIYENLKASINAQADADHVSKMALRPSRRSANDSRWQTSENLDLVLMAHYIATDASRKEQLLNAMCADASWCLGRNPGNIVEMTGLGQRHITDVYSTGRNDGAPGTHPGQTPFNGTETWSPGNGGDARILLQRCYPEWKNWPKQESYFNQRYMWVNAEFTPRETMRGKMALYAYLYGINK